jgi:hypothetical protein
VKHAMLLAGLAGLVVAAAPGTDSTAPDAAAKAAAYANKKICRTETDIGTRLGGKSICRTRAEWDEFRAEQRKAVDRAQTQSSACLRGGACGG